MNAHANLSADASAVLAKAILRASSQLGLKQAELGQALGMHRTAISKLKGASLDPQSKAGELALMLIRVSRALYGLCGGDEKLMQHFMRQPNTLTGGIPAEQVKSVSGLVNVLRFVDAIRAKV
ncbi:MbcA/ParS/Xre antitoxin family protein [Agaribacterium haliotis]|uniref:MbcA/ParS/Xre antitoxin family protein n=1 Tax=Agaribacterium haliotis TaxID=2013869 RepID=UPI000BB59ED7|nr:MbcA/ParS/Xre antitoxin family protein [Agaribacterium haliotis]